MLEEPLPYELPARASAIAGAKARVALRSSAPRMRQFSRSRLDIVPPVQVPRDRVSGEDMGRRTERRKNPHSKLQLTVETGKRNRQATAGPGLLDCPRASSQIMQGAPARRQG